jgi:hypothetical protein
MDTPLFFANMIESKHQLLRASLDARGNDQLY